MNHNSKSRLSTLLAVTTFVAGITAATLVTSSVAWGACAGTGTAIDASTLTLPGVAQAIGAPAAWAAGYDGAGVDVAVVDTGVDAVLGLASAGKVVDAIDLSFDATSPSVRYRDAFGHGTHMSGIIAGDSSGGPLTAGVAPKARIVNVKIGAGDGAVDVSQVIAALDWVVQNRTANGRNIRVISLSYDTDATTDYITDPLSHAVENAWKAGIVVVVSGGNDGRGAKTLGNPARNPFVIAVGGSTWDSQRLTFKIPTWSSTGDGVRNPDFVAPGDLVAGLRVPGSYLDTTFPAARVYDVQTCTNLFRGSGTSQAAAAVSGAAAILLQQRPSLTPDQVKALLASTAKPMGMPVTQQGSGMINVGVAMLAPTPATTQTFTRSTGTGLLEAARGTYHVANSATDVLTGEYDAFLSSFSTSGWATASNNRTAWSNLTFDGAGRFATGSWQGSSWSGSSWSGSSWSGSSWSGAKWTSSFGGKPMWVGVGWK